MELQNFKEMVDESSLDRKDEFYLKVKDYIKFFEIWVEAESNRWKNLAPFSKRNHPDSIKRDLESNVRYSKATTNLQASLSYLNIIIEKSTDNTNLEQKISICIQARKIYEESVREADSRADAYSKKNDIRLLKEIGYDKSEDD